MTGYPGFRLAFVVSAIDESTDVEAKRERSALCVQSFPLHHGDSTFLEKKREKERERERERQTEREI